jgi:hypothetical protein
MVIDARAARLQGGAFMSSGTVIRPPVDERAAAVEIASPKEDLLTVIFGLCMMIGTMTDGWAHQNILSDVQAEGFFTPWHGMLYAGFAATAAWTFWLAYRRRHRHTRWWLDAWPAGYRIGALGVLVFFAGGIGDMFWHTFIGIEVSLDALLSPSHLTLLVGSVLLLSSPTRSWWAAGGGGLRAATGVAALGIALMAASIFAIAPAFSSLVPTTVYNLGEAGTTDFSLAAYGVASYMVTIALLAVPLLMVHRRRPTFGTAAALVGAVALFPMVTQEFPMPLTAAAVAAVAAALLADWILLALDRARGLDAPLRLPIAGAVFGSLVTAAHLLGLHLAEGVRWPAELWSGSIVLAALVGAVLGGLAACPRD